MEACGRENIPVMVKVTAIKVPDTNLSTEKLEDKGNVRPLVHPEVLPFRSIRVPADKV